MLNIRKRDASGEYIMFIEQAQDPMVKVSECEQAILEYERWTGKIAHLLAVNGGFTRNLSDEDYATYRELAEQRDLAHNRMQMLEQVLLNE